jgi:hypothetical protein
MVTAQLLLAASSILAISRTILVSSLSRYTCSLVNQAPLAHRNHGGDGTAEEG